MTGSRLCSSGLSAGCLLLLVSACSPGDGSSGRRTRVAQGARFHQLEQRLLDSPGIESRYRITAEGAFQASLTGFLQALPGNLLRLEGSGSFGGNPVDMSLISDGTRMRVRTGGGVTDTATPPALAEASLEIDIETGVPKLRRRTVRFPTGEMRVVERYHEVDLEAKPDASVFTLPLR